MNRVDELQRVLFSDPEASLFAVLDGAAIDDLPGVLHDHRAEHVCLWRGELEPGIPETAPYVARLEPNTAFTRWLLEDGWGNAYGIFASADEELRAMRRHFRRFLRVIGPEGKPLYFRYYDPRILRVYLPTCNAEETEFVFGPVRSFSVESEDAGSLLRFTPGGDAAESREFALGG